MKNIYKSNLSNGRARKNLLNYFNHNEVSHQAGFTLIEIVVTLLIVGILAAIGGMGIVQAVNGYITVKENSATTQKAQLAMSRINREIIEMIDIPADAGSNVLPITNPAGNRIIGQDGNTIKMAFDTTTVGDVVSGDILIDNVKELNFKYWSGDPSTGANATTWDTDNDIMSLYAIDVSLTLNSPNLTFTTRVNPRNNANLGGQAAPSLTSPPAGWGCFVATAAYGNPNHIMVQVLRDFRDNHLVNGPGGKWFVKQYYKHGPVVADVIRNKPVAMWAVRCLLAPFAAIAFCLMYLPLAIPLLFFVSLIITMAIFNAFRRKPRLNTGLFHSRGSILIGLIITMVIMAILAAAMVPLFTSSYMNQVYADHGRKAYYIAESGFRYAAYKYRSEANEDDKNDVLSSMDGSVSYVMDDAGSFTLKVYPFWFETNATTTSAEDSVTTKYYGLRPTEFTTSSSGYIKVNKNYHQFTGLSFGTGTVTFNSLDPDIPATDADRAVQLVAQTSGSEQSLTKNGTLTLSSGYAIFPAINGSFTLTSSSGSDINSGREFNYKKRVGGTLYNITLANLTYNQNWTDPVAVPASSYVVLNRFIRLESTATVNGASRMITYNVPIGLQTGGEFQKVQTVEKMESDDNWFVASDQTMGTQTFNTTVDSSAALKIETMVYPDGGSFLNWLKGVLGWGRDGLWNAVFFNWGKTDTNLAQAWTDAGGFLSYDVQVKVKNDDPYFFAGLSFRGKNNAAVDDFYTYGVSFVRARQAYLLCGLALGWFNHCGGAYDDNIPYNLVPTTLFDGTLEEEWVGGILYRYSQPAIVFWKRDSTGFKTIAYKILTAADNVLTGTSPNFRLKPWSTLLVRISEGYTLDFSSGDTGVPIKEGDVITSSGSADWSARVVMTPVLPSSCAWTSGSSCSGKLVLANINGTFAGGNLQVNGTRRATTGTYNTTKKNYIRVYYSDNSEGTGDANETTNDRVGNQRDIVNWTPDDLSELTNANDYFTIVDWTDNSLYYYGTPITPSLTSGWNRGTNWTYDSKIHHSYEGASGIGGTASYSIPTINNTIYDVNMSIYRTNASGSATYDIGPDTGNNMTAGYIAWLTRDLDVNTFTADSDTTTITLRPTKPWGGTVTALTITPRIYYAVSSISGNDAIINDKDLTMPDLGGTPIDAIGLLTAGNTGDSTYYDDFAIQLNKKTGLAFGTPIQQ